VSHSQPSSPAALRPTPRWGWLAPAGGLTSPVLTAVACLWLHLPAVASEGLGFFHDSEERDALVLSPKERAQRRESRRIPKPNQALKAHQAVHTNAPPISPAERPIEGGVLPIKPRRFIPTAEVWTRQRLVNTNLPAAAPGRFNPDPGGRSRYGFELPTSAQRPAWTDRWLTWSERLRQRQDALGQELKARLPAPARDVVSQPPSPDQPAARRAAAETLARGLSAVISGPSLYDAQRFAGVALREETRALQGQDPAGEDLARFNRLLLEDAFPEDLPRHTGAFGTRPAFTPFVAGEPAPYPEYTGDPIPKELRPPRPTWQSSTLVPRPGPTWNPDRQFEPLTGTNALPRWDVRRNQPIEFQSHGTPHYEGLEDPRSVPANTQPVPDRYRLGFGFTPWHRYDQGLGAEQPFDRPTPRWWHPYYQSRLKGDLPVWGQDKFLNLTATSDTFAEFRSVPTPSAVSSARPDSSEFFGQNDQIGIQQYFGFAAELFSGETVFKPAHWTFKVVPVFNVNYALVRENNQLAPDPRGILGGPNQPGPNNQGVQNPADVGDLLNGQLTRLPDSLSGTRYTDRTRFMYALQEYFLEYHLADLSDNYDFFAIKAGNQAFNHDFRGFLFNDVNLGGRVFGNWDNNQWQYNLLGFDMREKDTFSGLNTFNQRDQRVFLANVYRQDFLRPGYTAQLSFAANLDDADVHYDRTGSIVRPQPFGTVRPHDVRAYYVGWAGDGHLGRWNVSHQFYQVFGQDTFNQLAGRQVDLNAQMAALEVSYDKDWLRTKGSFFYASGDADVNDGTGGGFDTILDNPNFTGGPFSYYVRQGFNFGGTGVGFKQPNSLVPNLRTSKTQGQASFVNPGLFLFGLGFDIDTTPKLKTFVNANYLRFAETDSLRAAVLQDNIRHEIGWDLSIGWQYRPLLTDNIVLSAGFGVLIPGEGYRDIYRISTDPVPTYNSFRHTGEVDSFLYSGVIAITFTY
jgi:hypothetical protein